MDEPTGALALPRGLVACLVGVFRHHRRLPVHLPILLGLAGLSVLAGSGRSGLVDWVVVEFAVELHIESGIFFLVLLDLAAVEEE